MRVTIRKKNLEITPPLRAYIEIKVIQPVEKLLHSDIGGDLPLLEIEVERTTHHHRKGFVYRIETNLTLGKRLIRAEAAAEDIRAACDIVEEELRRELTSYKSRSFSLLKRIARRVKHELRFNRAARLFQGRRVRDEGN